MAADDSLAVLGATFAQWDAFVGLVEQGLEAAIGPYEPDFEPTFMGPGDGSLCQERTKRLFVEIGKMAPVAGSSRALAAVKRHVFKAKAVRLDGAGNGDSGSGEVRVEWFWAQATAEQWQALVAFAEVGIEAAAAKAFTLHPKPLVLPDELQTEEGAVACMDRGHSLLADLQELRAMFLLQPLGAQYDPVPDAFEVHMSLNTFKSMWPDSVVFEQLALVC